MKERRSSTESDVRSGLEAIGFANLLKMRTWPKAKRQ